MLSLHDDTDLVDSLSGHAKEIPVRDGTGDRHRVQILVIGDEPELLHALSDLGILDPFVGLASNSATTIFR